MHRQCYQKRLGLRINEKMICTSSYSSSCPLPLPLPPPPPPVDVCAPSRLTANIKDFRLRFQHHIEQVMWGRPLTHTHTHIHDPPSAATYPGLSERERRRRRRRRTKQPRPRNEGDKEDNTTNLRSKEEKKGKKHTNTNTFHTITILSTCFCFFPSSLPPFLRCLPSLIPPSLPPSLSLSLSLLPPPFISPNLPSPHAPYLLHLSPSPPLRSQTTPRLPCFHTSSPSSVDRHALPSLPP